MNAKIYAKQTTSVSSRRFDTQPSNQWRDESILESWMNGRDTRPPTSISRQFLFTTTIGLSRHPFFFFFFATIGLLDLHWNLTWKRIFFKFKLIFFIFYFIFLRNFVDCSFYLLFLSVAVTCVASMSREICFRYARMKERFYLNVISRLNEKGLIHCLAPPWRSGLAERIRAYQHFYHRPIRAL